MIHTIRSLYQNLRSANSMIRKGNSMLSATPMRKPAKSRAQLVLLPNPKPYVVLPPHLAEVMELLLREGPRGISTVELRHLGVANPCNKIYKLRKLGALITTVKGIELHTSGEYRPNIGRYYYFGWAIV